MKNVTFNTLKIKNFLSIGEDEVKVEFTKGVHIITGINRDKEDRRNGVGKSTIADALYFAIFGTTIREIKKDFIVNNLTDGICEVQLSFNVNSTKGNDDFVIVRTLNPSKLHIYKNGNDKTRDSIINTNEYIEAVLSSSSEVFQNCVIMTLNNATPFMGKGKIEKRKFIEQVFNLQIFSQMLTKLREEYNDVKRNYDIEMVKYNEINNTIFTHEKQKEIRVKERELKINHFNDKIKANDNEISKVNIDISHSEKIDLTIKSNELITLNKGYDVVDEKIKKLIGENAELNGQIKHKQLQLNNIGTSADVCPTCLRPIEELDRSHFELAKNNLRIDIDESINTSVNYKNEIESFKNKNFKIKSHITKINDELNRLKIKIENVKSMIKRVQDLQELNKQINDNILHLNEHSDSFNSVLNESKSRLEDVKAEIEVVKKTINLLDVVKFVVSEEGVKSFIVKKILHNFNSKLAYYLKKLDSNSICVFNEYFEEEIVNEKGKVCSYNNFSGAERKAIDLACLFSFMDMRKSQGDVHYNISIYDELFDSSLDEKGVEIVLDILKERSEKFNEGIFIISHRKESTKLATGNIIFLEKHNGITRRINFVD